MVKSPRKRLYLKQRLYTLGMREGRPTIDYLDEFNKTIRDLENVDVKI